MIDDLVKNGDLEGILADADAFKEAVKGFTGMFDREVFDCFLVSDKVSGMFAAIMADKLNVTLVSSPAKVGKRKAIIMADSLGDGTALKKCVEEIEANGGEVLRIGCIYEKSSEGARKSKILRGYPFEALVEF